MPLVLLSRELRRAWFDVFHFEQGTPMSAWFVKGDVDGFFGLWMDNLINLLLIVSFLKGLLGFPDSLIFGRVLPAAALSLLGGNLYYTWQARRLAAREGRDDVTAMPYGLNTVTLFAFIFFVMLPVKLKTGSAEAAWQAGLAACFVSGVIETVGSLVGEHIRRLAPRAALLSALGGHRAHVHCHGFRVQNLGESTPLHDPDGNHTAPLFRRIPVSLRRAGRPRGGGGGSGPIRRHQGISGRDSCARGIGAPNLGPGPFIRRSFRSAGLGLSLRFHPHGP